MGIRDFGKKHLLTILILSSWATAPLFAMVDTLLFQDQATKGLVYATYPEGVSQQFQTFMNFLTQNLGSAIFFSAGILITKRYFEKIRGVKE